MSHHFDDAGRPFPILHMRQPSIRSSLPGVAE